MNLKPTVSLHSYQMDLGNTAEEDGVELKRTDSKIGRGKNHYGPGDPLMKPQPLSAGWRGRHFYTYFPATSPSRPNDKDRDVDGSCAHSAGYRRLHNQIRDALQYTARPR